MCLIPAAGEEIFRCPNMFNLVSFAWLTLDKCAVIRIGTLTGGPMCRESHPLCRLKNPKLVYMITCRLSSCKTGVYSLRLLIILKRGCSSMYRQKKNKLNKSYAKRAVTSFLKAILVYAFEMSVSLGYRKCEFCKLFSTFFSKCILWLHHDHVHFVCSLTILCFILK